ncbi:hypothetical protein SAMN05720781_0783 [Fibrobacter sp. UWT3]|uniref:hypothetical protein n=1 Tax=Fibrobacter sp. UWT3 TaxID=1896225 RepID=UPI000BD1A767|nr:hypothetical protein [Fibrobacter sp. UWT3]SOE54588.1 hypothetical protein SAMN05720781_0783 [Fibrobacter sp. UWT3]
MFFLKLWLILIVVCMVLCIIAMEIGRYMANADGNDADTARLLYNLYYLLIANIVLIIASLVVSALMGVLFSIYWPSWLDRALTNLRCLTKTTFSPGVATVCAAIPDIGYLIGIFILWDIARRQQKLLDVLGIQYTPVARRDLVLFVIFLLLANIVAYEGIVATRPGCFAACASIIGIMVTWLRVLRPCVEQGNKLYQLQQEVIKP